MSMCPNILCNSVPIHSLYYNKECFRAWVSKLWIWNVADIFSVSLTLQLSIFWGDWTTYSWAIVFVTRYNSSAGRTQNFSVTLPFWSHWFESGTQAYLFLFMFIGSTQQLGISSFRTLPKFPCNSRPQVAWGCYVKNNSLEIYIWQKYIWELKWIQMVRYWTNDLISREVS